MPTSSLKLRDVELSTIDIPLRRPFRFGVVELRELNHLRVTGTFDLRLPGGRLTRIAGTTGENLAPKWFEKRLETSLSADVASLRSAVARVVQLALELPGQPTPFDYWLALYRRAEEALPDLAPLVRQLGVSLIERVAIDAWCRAAERPFWKLLQGGALGFEPGKVDGGLAGDWRGSLPAQPAGFLQVRHTVGLGDDPSELPAILGQTGIRRLKVKLGGDPARDRDRLRDVVAAFPAVERITLDGNENYKAAATLSEFLRLLETSAELDRARERIAWIEQALHRDVALSEEFRTLRSAHPWALHVIDESDASLADLPRALSLGYAGTTHKCCKGIFKSVLAAVRLRGRPNAILSAEDLTIVAPWTQTQDLAVAAAVGAVDVERNGHHYAGDLAAFPLEVSERAARHHPDLYAPGETGAAALRIRDGRLDLTSANAAPFGWGVPT